jgi:hypothetical protein
MFCTSARLVAASDGAAAALLRHDRLRAARPIGGIVLGAQIVGDGGIEDFLDDLTRASGDVDLVPDCRQHARRVSNSERNILIF